MLDGFKTEISFVQNSQRERRAEVDEEYGRNGANKGYSASQKHLSVQQIEAIKH